MTHEELKAKALQNPTVAEEYEKLEEEFSLWKLMLAEPNYKSAHSP
ncbi:hypothetical protein [Acaryochloris sp. IP29b_bin.137]|nr:hypothetical protein [Acaryochloris sp. IP29b_bin.137]